MWPRRAFREARTLQLLPSKIKQVLPRRFCRKNRKNRKNTLDIRDRSAKVCPIDMKNNPLTSVLLGVLTVSTLASVVLCGMFNHNVRHKNSLQHDASVMINNRNVMSALVNDTLEYSKKNPDIDPILESLRLKPGKSAPAATSKPATK